MTKDQLIEHFTMTISTAKAIDAARVEIPIGQLEELLELAKNAPEQPIGASLASQA